jgi:hypothetical protein
MKKLFFSFLMFLSTYLLLSININNESVFNLLYRFTSPYSNELQTKIELMMEKSVDNTKEIGKKIFQNSSPSLNKKTKAPVKDHLTEADKNDLKNLIEEI